ncbi:hypothetical protein QE380_000476 [Acinetobacter baylyi]|uniref:Uncharacterized protein n=1 Tax=Acinetobacter baylyi TaxID=202950 RepID=A0ABU0UTC2_ACIBI|nr:hypothetical protein [Acinetobacter baylyi]MDQ1207553.1 hypothetical protein [Acinetobacter baylyi]MDR6105371.1 hypothetical protein [Acinetobacter baylyi]MDR6184419.1 hypothetical protein [Acinetobacter baylyi]
MLFLAVQCTAQVQYHLDSMSGEDTPVPDQIKEKCTNLPAILIRESSFATKFFDAMI